MRHMPWRAALRRVAGIVALAAGLTAWGLSARAEGDTKRDVRAVISAQIAAFQSDDAETAFSFAAPGIRSRFGTAERFMEMVRSTYQPVYRPERVLFAELRETDDLAVQRVLVFARDGGAFQLFYFLRRLSPSVWRIDGVRMFALDESPI